MGSGETRNVMVYRNGVFYKSTYEQQWKRIQDRLGQVWVFSGGRGSGKTLSMTYFAGEAMLNGHKVWSNYPIAFDFLWSGKGIEPHVKHYESIPLNMDSIYTFSDELASGIVCIDEISLWASARRSMSVANRLLNSIMTLIRKRRLSFMFTVQNFQWLDSQLRFQTDLWFLCRDQYHYRPHQLERGQFISLTIRDMSGYMTGIPWTEFKTGRNEVKANLWGKPFWKCYNTWEEFDVADATRPIKILSDAHIIDRRTNGHGQDRADRERMIQEALSILREVQADQLTSAEVQELFNHTMDMDIDSRHLGRIMRSAGWQYRQTRKGNFYQKPEK